MALLALTSGAVHVHVNPGAAQGWAGQGIEGQQPAARQARRALHPHQNPPRPNPHPAPPPPAAAIMTSLLGDGGLMVEQVPDLGVLQALRVSEQLASLQGWCSGQ